MLYFKYGTMNAGKSIELIKTIHNYEENNFKVLVMKPKIDTKGGSYIKARVGSKRKADILIGKHDNIKNLIKNKLKNIKAILVDEAQFLSTEQINQLFIITKVTKIPVICYGLRTNFMAESFEGSKRLLELADELETLPTLCQCGNIAQLVARKKDGIYQKKGKEIIIDGKAHYEYEPICADCYLQKVKKINYQKEMEELNWTKE